MADVYQFFQTAWGTRDGADEDDANRMIRVSRKAQEAGTIDLSLDSNPACLIDEKGPRAFGAYHYDLRPGA